MKTLLRSGKLLERLNHHKKEKKRKDLMITEKLCGLDPVKKAKTILFYLPIHREVDLKPLFEKLRKQKKEFILPRVKDEKTLHLYRINNLDELECGRYKIPEPKLHLKRVKISDVDIVLVPGIVFARNGHRIGYGKGFYDRLLKNFKGSKIGIAYDFQMVENIPGEPHDAPMDIIVTEKEIIRIIND